MKFSVVLVLLVGVMARGEVRHKVIFRGGSAMTGYVSEMTHDSLKVIPSSGGRQVSVALDTVLYVHNSKGKLFYLAPQIRKFFEKGLGRGGIITTVGGEDIHYRRLGRELFMFAPKLVYETKEKPERHEIMLTDIHKVQLDHTVSEYAVKKGALAGAGVTTFLFLIEFKAIKELFNLSKLFNTANAAYKTGTTIIPLTTLGWVAYDFFRGERELIINPLKEKKPFRP